MSFTISGPAKHSTTTLEMAAAGTTTGTTSPKTGPVAGLKKAKKETDKTVQAPDDLAREKGKAPDKNGEIISNRLAAGGPGSGRHRLNFTMQDAISKKSFHEGEAAKHTKVLSKLYNKKINTKDGLSKEDKSSYSQHEKQENLHEKAAQHFSKAAAYHRQAMHIGSTTGEGSYLNNTVAKANTSFAKGSKI